LPTKDSSAYSPPALLTTLVLASPSASWMKRELGSVDRRLFCEAPMNRLVPALASCTASTVKLFDPSDFVYLAVLLHVQSVAELLFSLIELLKLGSEFSGVIAL
jgi:hypothetical protein